MDNNNYIEEMNESIFNPAAHRTVFLNIPTVFVVGIQRSGTSLLNQLIINTLQCSYPSNLISRFWNSPVNGQALQNSLNLVEKLDYRSDLGYTEEITGPHEFGFFWKRFLSHIPDGNLMKDEKLFLNDLSRWYQLEQRPLVFKNIIHAGMNIYKLSRLLPKSLIIYIEREPIYVIQSSLESRRRLFNDDRKWFGVYPPNYKELLNNKPLLEITDQVKSASEHLNHQLLQISSERVFRIKYEDLVSNTENKILDLKRFFSVHCLALKNIEFPDLEDKNTLRLSIEDLNFVQKRWNK